MMPLRSITSRTITAPGCLGRRSTRASITTPALKLGWKVDGVSPMGGSALADIAAQMPESQTHLTQEPDQSAVSANMVGCHEHEGSPRHPAAGLQDQLPRPVRQLLVPPTMLAAVALRGSERGQEGQRPN